MHGRFLVRALEAASITWKYISNNQLIQINSFIKFNKMYRLSKESSSVESSRLDSSLKWITLIYDFYYGDVIISPCYHLYQQPRWRKQYLDIAFETNKIVIIIDVNNDNITSPCQLHSQWRHWLKKHFNMVSD